MSLVARIHDINGNEDQVLPGQTIESNLGEQQPRLVNMMVDLVSGSCPAHHRTALIGSIYGS